MKKFHIPLVSVLALALLLMQGSQALAGDHKAEDHKGPYVQAAAMGIIDLPIGDNSRIFDMGPGAFIGLGYNFGILGLRTNFHYGQMDGKKSTLLTSLIDSDLYGGSLELKIMPLGEKDSCIQPYLVAGAGAHYLDLNLAGVFGNGDWGFAGNGGLGVDFYIVNGLALTVEANIRPTVFYTSDVPPGFGNDYDMYFYDFMGGLTYSFGGKPREKTAAPPPPPPAPAPVYKKGDKIDLRGQINFKSGSAEILPSSYPVLDDAVTKMKNHPEIAVVEIEGHTDSQGADAYNQTLSQRRTDTVKKYFTGKGIESSRLTTKGFGESQPVATNDTAEGRAQNRRIEFKVIEFK